MIQKLKRSKIQVIMIFCLSTLLFSLIAVKLEVTAKESLPYYIKVNKQQNCVTVYEKDKNGKYTVPVKAMACSTGYATPLGIYKTPVKYRWKLLMGDVWGQYSTRIVNGILFHSVWYYKMDAATLSSKQYNKLGTTASHGCIRLTVADAKWIYDNCPIGTTVEIYNSKDPGPLGKPESLILKEGTGWDPTDLNPKNPFTGKTPTITGVSNKTVEWGAKINLLDKVKASSTTGTDITSNIKVEGKVDTSIAGKYKIIYNVTDAIGRSKTRSATITVKKNEVEPRFEGVKDHVVDSATVINRSFALKGVTAYLGDTKLSNQNIKINIKKDTDSTYIIQYSIKSNNGLVGKATAIAYYDSKAPVLLRIEHKALTLEQFELGAYGIKKLALKGVTVTDDYTPLKPDQVKVSVKEISDYAYRITYKVTDDVGNIATETVQYTYFDNTTVEGVFNHINLSYGTEITEEYVKQGVTASNSTGDCTDLMTVTINNTDKDKYEVIYTIQDEYGYDLSIVSYFTVKGEPITK